MRVEDRSTVLRRTADDTDPFERIVVANAEQLLIVVALADPPPRTGLVERALVAAYAGGLAPLLGLTKSDLADPDEFAAHFTDLDIPVLLVGQDDDLTALHERIDGRVTALIGHSGVGKSTLVNRLVPDADRATGEVSGVGKDGTPPPSRWPCTCPRRWVVDTPGIRSFGLAHIGPDDVVAAFGDLAEAVEDCRAGARISARPPIPNAPSTRWRASRTTGRWPCANCSRRSRPTTLGEPTNPG